MRNQFNFKMRTCLFLFGKKRIVVTPGITDETISWCRRPALFGSRVLYEIGILRHNNKPHVLLRVVTNVPKCFFCEGMY